MRSEEFACKTHSVHQWSQKHRVGASDSLKCSNTNRGYHTDTPVFNPALQLQVNEPAWTHASDPRLRGGAVLYMTPLSTKIGKLFMPFIYMTTAFWKSENANIWKGVSKCKLLKTIPLLSPCTLQKQEFVKTVTSYTCILLVHIVFLYKVTSPTTGRPLMHNTAF